MGTRNKILSVDDSLTMRKIIKSHVEALGYELLEASEGANGLQVLNNEIHNIGLILLDWNMPGMNGMEFLQKVKSNVLYHNIPIIMVTTEAERESIVKAVQQGVSNYILKPFTNEELTKKINQCIRRD
ncbi:MAG: response regulator [Firmicutes bacterium HGW-Firmicutes-1]|jgi:two-component system chemotaxis response regulator CheY|nr:MAG: response regulator [Firmicutes bacterium HGW-Firmicutes-1]